MPGTDADDYVDGLGGLKAIGYNQYISLECGFKSGQDKDEGVKSAFELLKEQWDRATA